MSNGILLCIDDDVAGLRVRELIFRAAGYEVICASSGSTGLGLFARTKVDLVVLDYAMPDLNGVEVAAIMRNMNPHVPILMLSGAYLDSIPLNGVVDSYLDKTVHPSELLARINRLLRRFQGGQTGPTAMD